MSDIVMPASFPETDFRAFGLAANAFFPGAVSKEALFDPEEKRRHFEWSWQAVRYRYRSCAECNDEFKTDSAPRLHTLAFPSSYLEASSTFLCFLPLFSFRGLLAAPAATCACRSPGVTIPWSVPAAWPPGKLRCAEGDENPSWRFRIPQSRMIGNSTGRVAHPRNGRNSITCSA
jgi:hypothetical protein